MGYIKDLPTCKTITNNGKLVYTDDGVHSSTIKIEKLADAIKDSRNTSQSDSVEPSEIGGEDGIFWKSEVEDDGSALREYKNGRGTNVLKEFYPRVYSYNNSGSRLYNYGNIFDRTLTDRLGIEILQEIFDLCESARYRNGILIDTDYKIYSEFLKAIGIISKNLGTVEVNVSIFTSKEVDNNYTNIGGYSALEREFPNHHDKVHSYWFRLEDCMPWVFDEHPDVPRLQYLKDWVVLPYMEYKSNSSKTSWQYIAYDEDSPLWDPDNVSPQSSPTTIKFAHGGAATATGYFRILAPAVYYQFDEFKMYFVKHTGDQTRYWNDYTSSYKKCNGIAWNRFDGLIPQVMQEIYPYEYKYSPMIPGPIDVYGDPLYCMYTHVYGDTYFGVSLDGLIGDSYETPPTQSQLHQLEEVCKTGNAPGEWISGWYDLPDVESLGILADRWFADDDVCTPYHGFNFWKKGYIYTNGMVGSLVDYFPFNEMYQSDHDPNPFYDDLKNARWGNPHILPNCLVNYNERNAIIGGFGAVTDQLTEFSLLTIGLDRFKIGVPIVNNFIFNGKRYEQYLYDYITNDIDAKVTSFIVDGHELALRNIYGHDAKKVHLHLDTSMRYYRITPIDPLPPDQFRIGVKPDVAALYPPITFINGGIDSNGLLQAEAIIKNIKINNVDAIDIVTKEVNIDFANAPSIKECRFSGDARTQGLINPVMTGEHEEEVSGHYHIYKDYRFNITRYNMIGSTTTRDFIVSSGNANFGPCQPGTAGPYFAGPMYSIEHSIAIFRITVKCPIDATFILFLIPSGVNVNTYRPFDPNDASYDPTYTDFDVVEVKAGIPTTLEVVKIMEDGDNTTRTAYIEHSIDTQTWSAEYSSWDPKPSLYYTTFFKYLMNL